MSTTVYYLDSARTDAVTASWGMFFRNFKLEYAGQPLVETDASRSLQQGRDYLLPDGRTLSVRLQQKFGAQGLDMQVDGQPVGGTINDPQAQVNTAFGVLLFIAGISILLGVLALVGNFEALSKLGLGWGSIIESLFYLGLAWLGKYRLSAVAFYVALALLVLDGIFLLSAAGGGFSSGVFMRIFLGIAVFRGATGARQLRARQAVG